MCLQVRKSQGWDVQQHMRFISGGQELFLDDSVSKALGSVLHCIASQVPAQKVTTKAGHGQGQKGAQHSAAVDWVSPGKTGSKRLHHVLLGGLTYTGHCK